MTGGEKLGRQRLTGLRTPNPARPRVADERGAGSVLALSMVAVLVLVTTVIGVAASYLVLDRRAAGAADLAALAGARAHVEGGAACVAARATAESNGAAVTRCDVRGAEPVWVVAVTVEVRAPTRLPGLPGMLPRSAWAGTAEADPSSR